MKEAIAISPTEAKDEIPMRPKVGASKMDAYIDSLRGKNIAIVGNQTSLVDGVHLVDTLISRGISVIKVFAPEHGFRGEANAGEYVANGIDQQTGVPVVSLYGKNKKPSTAQLSGVDVVVFDIQDVGVRFYTYISTLHYVMEACAEQGIPVIILDRPNPNGHYVDGPVLDPSYTSFVGMHPVPIVHGMTIGEYGTMVNGEKWLEGGISCDLTVIKCDYYYHGSVWPIEVRPSPNLRSDLSIALYPSLCLLEATDVTVGRGTPYPFEQYGHPKFPDSLEYSFTPKPDFGSKDPKHNGELCYAIKPDEKQYARMHQLDLSFLLDAYEKMNGDLFRGNKTRMFFLLYGRGDILELLKSGKTEAEIRATWTEDLESYKKMREKYLLYYE
ncbi:MAG: exo-beta-N-acetylmuramidase NamZ domain-containing protein [Fluviicola sp.]